MHSFYLYFLRPYQKNKEERKKDGKEDRQKDIYEDSEEFTIYERRQAKIKYLHT